MLIDCSILNDEVELLALRIALLGPHVDAFVVAEAAETFTGHPKPLWLSENRDRFAEAPIHPVVVTFPSDMTDPWQREWHTRDTLQKAAQALDPSGVALLADVDEFPSDEQLRDARATTDVRCVPMRTYYRRLNWSFVPDTPTHYPKLVPLSQDLRFSEARPLLRDLPSVPGEWGAHLSYMGYDADAMAAKLAAFSHTEHNLASYSSTAHLEVCDRYHLDHLVRRKLPGHGLLHAEPPAEWSPLQHWFAERQPSWIGSDATDAAPLTREAIVVMLERDLRTGHGEVAATLATRPWHPRLWTRWVRALVAVARLRWHESRAR